MVRIVLFALSLLAFSSWGPVAQAQEQEKQQEQKPPAKVTFLNPASERDAFYGPLSAVMKDAARDLGVELTVVSANNNHLAHKRKGRDILKGAALPDYLILVNADDAAADLMRMAEEKGVKTFLLNEDLNDIEQTRLGLPRQKLINWIGNMQPNDQQSGALLADHLIKQARRKGLAFGDGTLQLVALNDDASPAFRDRLMGLNDTLSRNPLVKLEKVAYAYGDKLKAHSATNAMLRRHPSLQIIWSADDTMASGAYHAVKSKGLIPGKDVLIGATGWSDEILDLVKKGDITAAVGGHFLNGAWTMVMLHDHHNGYDFPPNIQTKFSILHSQNINQFRRHIQKTSDWTKIDFAKFSRAHVSEIEYYDFTLRALMSQF